MAYRRVVARICFHPWGPTVGRSALRVPDTPEEDVDALCAALRISG
jgi:hypothetical protein